MEPPFWTALIASSVAGRRYLSWDRHHSALCSLGATERDLFYVLCCRGADRGSLLLAFLAAALSTPVGMHGCSSPNP